MAEMVISNDRAGKAIQTTVRALFGALCALSLFAGCQKERNQAAPAASSAPTAARVDASGRLPAPFQTVSLGASRADLLERFVAAEDLSACRWRVIREKDEDVGAPGTAKACCVSSSHVAGLNETEAKHVADSVRQKADSVKGALSGALVHAVAQIRGAVRAGVLEPKHVLSATREGTLWDHAVLTSAAVLVDGAHEFSTKGKGCGRICQALGEGCRTVDGPRLRAYVSGPLVAPEDAAKQEQRTKQGECAAAYREALPALRRDFVRRAGVLFGVGLARRQADPALDPDAEAALSRYASLTELDKEPARLALRILRATDPIEAFWNGAVALEPQKPSEFSSVVVWFDEDRVARVLVNLAAKPLRIETSLQSLWGEGTAQGERVRQWIGDEVVATLDWGPELSLTVKNKQ